MVSGLFFNLEWGPISIAFFADPPRRASARVDSDVEKPATTRIGRHTERTQWRSSTLSPPFPSRRPRRPASASRSAARGRGRRPVRGLRGGGEAEQKGSHDSGASSLLPTSPPTRASRALEPNEPAAGAGPRRAREAIATPRPHPTRSRPPPRARRRRACGRGNRQNPERWGFFPRASASRFRFRPSPRSRDPSHERSRGRALTAPPTPIPHPPLSTEPQGASA